MVRYEARHINISLIATSLAASTSTAPATTRLNPKSIAEVKRCEDAFNPGITLREKLIPDPESITATGLPSVNTNFRIIGDDFNPFPMQLVHASRNPEDSTTPRDDVPANNINITSTDIFALAIKIAYDRKTTLHTEERDAQKKAGGTRSDEPDLRYDVFLNGDLVRSDYLKAKKLKSEEWPSPDAIYASGRRVHRFLERPIVVVPKGLNAKGELSAYSKRKGSTLQERWKKIGKELAGYAENIRYYRSDLEKDSPLAIYLDTLAELYMPAELEKNHPSGAQVFGVIDVVLTKGKATRSSGVFPPKPRILMQSLQKRETIPVYEPTRIRASAKLETPPQLGVTTTSKAHSLGADQATDQSTSANISPTRTPTGITDIVPQQKLLHGSALSTRSADTSQMSHVAVPDASRFTMSDSRHLGSAPDLSSSKSTNRKPTSRISSGRKKVEDHIPKTIETKKRRRSGTIDEDDEQRHFKRQQRERGSSNATSEMSNDTNASAITTVQVLPNSQLSLNSAAPQAEAPETTRARSKKNENKSGQVNLPPGVSLKVPDALDLEREAWKTPVLCRDSFVTYAEDGIQNKEDNANYLRQVKERMYGQFDDEEFLYAARYIVC